MAFASHGLGQQDMCQDSVEELAEQEGARLDSRLSQANLSLALTNVHGQSNTRLSSGRASQAGQSRARLSRQARNIYMSNNVTADPGLDASSQLREAETATMARPTGSNARDAASSQGLLSASANRLAKGAARKQSVAVGQGAHHSPPKHAQTPSRRQRPKTAALRRSQNTATTTVQHGGVAPSAFYQPSQLTDSDAAAGKSRPRAKLQIKKRWSSKDRKLDQKLASEMLSPQAEAYHNV